MCVAKSGNTRMKIQIDRQPVEQVSTFRYLGSLISEDDYCENDIRCRNEMGKKTFMNMKKVITGNLNLDLKKELSNV